MILDQSGKPARPEPPKARYKAVTLNLQQELYDFISTVYEAALKCPAVNPKPADFDDFVMAMARNGADIIRQVIARYEATNKAIVVADHLPVNLDTAAKQLARWGGRTH